MVSILKRLPPVLVALALLLAASSPAFGAPKFTGRWSLTVTIPESPGSAGERTFTVTVDASPRGESLHGRATIADAEGHTVGGTWRQASKKISVAYELPCAGDGPCASLILTGKLKSSGTKIKNGNVIVMWDTPNAQNPALFDTSNGSFKGDRLE
jgi:hypothetical protein